MNADFEKENILEMKPHSETHLENENMFSEKWKAILYWTWIWIEIWKSNTVSN